MTVIEDIGLPSGIDRTLVVDLTGKFLSGDHAVRIVTNLCVYWDEAFFSVGEDGLTLAVRALTPVSADLHYRGFSVPVLDRVGSKADSYDYARLLEEPPWNAASGRYTAFGDVRPLLDSPDNRLVVMAPGDELSLAFDTAALPQLEPGLRRDFVFHVTGWAKDNEPATAASRSVEPLPFRGMSSYPYPPNEAIFIAGESRSREVPLQIPPLAPPGSRRPRSQ